MSEFSILSSKGGEREEKFCPLLFNPELDCYCFDLDSQSIALALKYCHGNYLACEIYQRMQWQSDL